MVVLFTRPLVRISITFVTSGTQTLLTHAALSAIAIAFEERFDPD
jgi:hypothetical protein